MQEKPAPVPTQQPDIVPDAQKVGDNNVDTDKPLTPEAKPKPVEAAAPRRRPLSPKPEGRSPKPTDPPRRSPRQAGRGRSPSRMRRRPRPTPDPAAQAGGQARSGRREPIVAEQRRSAETDEACRMSAPAPEARPKPPEATDRQGAGPQGRREAGQGSVVQAEIGRDRNSTPTRSPPSSTRRSRPAAAPSARRDEASLGGDKTRPAASSSQSEMDALRGQLERLLEHSGRRAGGPKSLQRLGQVQPRPSRQARGRARDRTVERRPASSTSSADARACRNAMRRPTTFQPTSMTSGPTSSSISIRARCSERRRRPTSKRLCDEEFPEDAADGRRDCHRRSRRRHAAGARARRDRRQQGQDRAAADRHHRLPGAAMASAPRSRRSSPPT